MPNFKVGDKVRLVKMYSDGENRAFDRDELTVGEEYVICSVDDFCFYPFKLFGTEWWVEADMIELVKQADLVGEEYEDVTSIDDPANAPKSALDVQVDGNHYKTLAIQPAEYGHKNNLGFLQTNAIKYITRFKDKAGKKDLEKAIHCIQMLIEFEYGNDK